MTHPDSEALLTRLYPDDESTGQLDPGGQLELDTHLAVCPECRQQLAQWRAILGLLDEDSLPLGVPSLQKSPGAVVPMAAAAPKRSRPPQRREWLPWALAGGVAVAAAFLAGRWSGMSRTALRSEVARLRSEITQEISAELRATQPQTLTRIAGVAVTAAAGQQELTLALAADFNTARLQDRREFLAAIERSDRRRAEEFEWLRSGFQLLADKTGGALEVTDNRLNALANALPPTATDGGK